MILVLALTQFAFLILGIVFLKILVNATTESLPAALIAFNHDSIWLLAIPLIWVFFVSVFGRSGTPIARRVTATTGVGVAMICFLFLALVAYWFAS